MMSHSEDEQLLLPNDDKYTQNGQNTGEKLSDNIQDKYEIKYKKPARTVVVEPLLLLYMISGVPSIALQNQYRYLKVAKTMNINITLNDNNSTCDTNLNDSHFLDREKVQAEAAKWNMYIAVLEFVLTFTMGFVFGSLSDKFGRKPLFILPCIGSIVGVIINMAIVYFDLPLYWFLFTTVEFFSGSMTTLFTGCFTYLADTVPKHALAFRMTILDAVMLSAAGLSNLGVGYWIQSVGYFWPYIFVISGKFLSLLYAIFFIPETVVQDSQHKTKETPLQHLTKGFKLMTIDDGTGKRFKIDIILLAYFVGDVFMGYMIFSLFEMNAPLCWNSVMMGYYEAVSMFVRCIAMVIGTAILRKFFISEESQAIISRLSAIAEYIFLIFVTNSVMMFFVPLLGGFVFLYLPMFRAILSKLVGLDEQGAMLATFASIGRVNHFVGSLLTNKVYSATLLFMEGFVFLMCAITAALSLGIFMIYVVRVRRERAQLQQESYKHIQEEKLN